jgi:hypothetical protein
MASLFSLVRSAAKSLNGGSLFCHQIVRKTSLHIVYWPADCFSCKVTECADAASPSSEKAHTNSVFFCRDILKVSQNTNINVKKYNSDLCRLDLDPVVAYC